MDEEYVLREKREEEAPDGCKGCHRLHDPCKYALRISGMFPCPEDEDFSSNN